MTAGIERFEQPDVQELCCMPPTFQPERTELAPVDDGGFLTPDVEVIVRPRPGMIAQRGINFFQIRKHADKAMRPKHIITADSPDPKEIDDGVFVEALPTATEMYRVGVCLPNTAKLYQRHDVLRPAMVQLHAEYRIDDDGVGYVPLIDETFIRKCEMSQGEERNALVLRFIVGQNHPPSDASISFEKVYVDRNFDYRQFSEHTRPSGQYERYARAGHYILEQLRFSDSQDTAAITQADTLEMVRYLMKQQPDRLYVAGPSLTAAFMVATNHLGGLVLQDAGRVGINRIFDPGSSAPHDFLPSNMARFSMTPGPHVGLGLSNVLQITSPLRRVQDGINGVQLWKLARGMRQDQGDLRVIEQATHALNFEIAQKYNRRLMHKLYPRADDTYVARVAQEYTVESTDSLTA